MEQPGQRKGGHHFGRIDVAFEFSVEEFGEIGGPEKNLNLMGANVLLEIYGAWS